MKDGFRIVNNCGESGGQTVAFTFPSVIRQTINLASRIIS